jgi:methionyl-tRNA formyltransferase
MKCDFLGKGELGIRCYQELVKRDIVPTLIKPDIRFCIGLTEIVPKELLEIPCINIHPALLPKYRGRYSIPHAIFNGEEWTGATIHYMDKGIDSGSIIMQERFKIEPTDTSKLVWDKFNVLGAELFGKFLDLWLSGKPINSYPQDNIYATYYPKALPNNGMIDLSWDAEKVKRFVRAMTYVPYPIWKK